MSTAVAGSPIYCCSVQNDTLVEFTSTAVYGVAAIVFEPVGPARATVCA
jgi:hypothetical protein